MPRQIDHSLVCSVQSRILRLQDQVSQCMLRDQPRLLRRLRTLGRAEPSAAQTRCQLDALVRELEDSRARRARREREAVRLQFPDNLPVCQARERIVQCLCRSQVVIVCGETGSGKTTQLPKICLSMGRGRAGMIAHTQPRRIAARAVAARLAAELGGGGRCQVGYKVRFTEQVPADALIKLMTDGVLLAEIRADKLLLQYDTVIIDEAHERSLNIDLLLGYLRQIMPRRPDLKVVVTSATIDPTGFSRYFAGAPVVEVSGRTYPVAVRYRPVSDSGDESEHARQRAIVAAVEEVRSLGRGDILVFLSGEREIRETYRLLRSRALHGVDLIPLYARLTMAEQQRVFEAHENTRIVLATNVAETSLTVPGIRYVIDTGRARISRYSQRSKVQRLPVEPISRASAEQRKGRCGRVAAGVCIRLYSEQDYLSRPMYTPPEILRTNLATVILQMQDLGFTDIERFPFIDPPERTFLNDGYRLLHELGAIDERRSITPLGRRLARLPIDPRLGRMIVGANTQTCLREVLVIASALSLQDPRERPMEARQLADARHAEFADRRSDFISLLNLWDWFGAQRRRLSRRKLRMACGERFLSYVRMLEWVEVHSQIKSLVLADKNVLVNTRAATYAAIHRALLGGLLSHLGVRQEDATYRGARGNRLFIFPASALSSSRPKWIVAAELVQTSRLYGVTCGRVDPAWVEATAGHLVKRDYSDAHWDPRSGRVMAYETVSLYGLDVVSRRRIDYGRIAPQGAREIFIRSALVGGEADIRAAFVQHNRALIEQVELLEKKSRRRDVLVNEDEVYAFYDQRLPSDIHNTGAFKRWRCRAEERTPRLLFMEREMLMRHAAEGVTAEAYPDHLTVGGLHLALRYVFAPGSPEDGVQVAVPLSLLNQLRAEWFDWLIPGWQHELIVALIRLLPKSLRKLLVPAPDVASACLKEIVPGKQPLLDAISAYVRKVRGVEIPAAAWRMDLLPEHLRVLFKVLDEQGRVVAQGRDLHALQVRWGEAARCRFERLLARVNPRAERNTRWSFDPLPVRVELADQGVRAFAYPALRDAGRAVRVVACDSAVSAQRVHRRGLRRLFALQVPRRIEAAERQLPDLQRLCLLYSTAPVAHWVQEGASARTSSGDGGLCEELQEMLIGAVLDAAFLTDGEDIRDGGVFVQRLREGECRLDQAAREVGTLVTEVFALWRRIVGLLAEGEPPAWAVSIADIRCQLRGLIYRGFLDDVARERLRHYPRYLRAIVVRLERLRADPVRDRRKLGQVQDLWEQCLASMREVRANDGWRRELLEFRWAIEELRISLFAQEIPTAMPISRKRLLEQWQGITPVKFSVGP